MKNFSSKTRESSHHSSKRTNIVRLFGVTFAVLLCLFLLGRLIGKVASLAITPVYTVSHWFQVSTAPLPSYIRGRAELVDEITKLKEDLSTRSGSDATISKLLSENETLKSLLTAKDSERIASGVIARPPELPYDALLIDRGSNDGIHEGGVVYYAHDQVIGFVSKVFKGSSLVTLFSTNGVKGTAYIFGTNTYVPMSGEGGGVIVLSVPQGVTVAVGDVVVLPGLPMGILGTISEIRSIATEPEQQAFVTFNVPIQSLSVVGVSMRVIEKISFEEAEHYIHTWDYHELGIDIPKVVTESSSSTRATSSVLNKTN